MLTAKQKELLLYINQRLKETGVSPSFDEMKEALDLASKSGIHRLITALEERGFIRRLAHRARALEVLKLPDAAAPLSARSRANAAGFKPSVVANAGGAVQSASSEAGYDIPILGKIAAGVPIEAIQQEVARIAAPADLLSSGEHFALEVRGESMVGAGILDGDIVILQRTENANSGDIVVALVDNTEATLKRLRKRGGSIALEAANPDFGTKIYGPDRVKVQGKLVALIRRYP
jgi:repressor LexA